MGWEDAHRAVAPGSSLRSQDIWGRARALAVWLKTHSTNLHILKKEQLYVLNSRNIFNLLTCEGNFGDISPFIFYVHDIPSFCIPANTIFKPAFCELALGKNLEMFYSLTKLRHLVSRPFLPVYRRVRGELAFFVFETLEVP